MKCISMAMFLVLSLLSSCASSVKVLESDFQKLRATNTGALLTVNLETNGRVRDDKKCYLHIFDGKESLELFIERGTGDYALPIQNIGQLSEITKITCGPFYYYSLKDQGATFKVVDQRIKYIGIVNFKLLDKGKLEWGHAATSRTQLLERAQSLGLDSESLEIDLLKL